MSSPSSKSIDHWSYPTGEINRKSKGVHTPSNWIQAKPSFRCTENLTWLHLICHVSSKFLYIHMHIIIARLRSAHKKFNNPFMCVWLGIMQRANRSDLIGKLTFWYSNVYTCNDLNKIISFAYKKKNEKKNDAAIIFHFLPVCSLNQLTVIKCNHMASKLIEHKVENESDHQTRRRRVKLAGLGGWSIFSSGFFRVKGGKWMKCPKYPDAVDELKPSCDWLLSWTSPL